MLKVDFTKAKKLDKQGLDYLKRYLNSKYTRLDDCYTSYSTSKQIAYNNNLWLMQDLDGKDFKILGYNCNFFTVAFLVKKDDNFYLFVNTGRNIFLYKFNYLFLAFRLANEDYNKFKDLARGV